MLLFVYKLEQGKVKTKQEEDASEQWNLSSDHKSNGWARRHNQSTH